MFFRSGSKFSNPDKWKFYRALIYIFEEQEDAIEARPMNFSL